MSPADAGAGYVVITRSAPDVYHATVGLDGRALVFDAAAATQRAGRVHVPGTDAELPVGPACAVPVDVARRWFGDGL